MREVFFEVLLLGVMLSATGEVRNVINPPEMGMLDIPSGSFVMGNDTSPFWDQKPAHRITLSQPFRISITEITLTQYRQFRPDWDIASPDGFVRGVSWHDAVGFCEWLSRVTAYRSTKLMANHDARSRLTESPSTLPPKLPFVIVE